MRISGSGIARLGREAIKHRRALYHADSAISVLHDALLAVAKGKIAPEEVREFFWRGGELERSEYFGDMLILDDKPEIPA